MHKIFLSVMFCIISLCGLFIFPMLAHADAIKWQNLSDTNFEQVKKENRLILVFGKASWCRWCQKMESTTWQDPNVIKIIEKFYTPILVDIDKDTKVAVQFKILDLPTAIILDANRQPIKRIAGYFPPEVMLKYLQETAKDYRSGSLNSLPSNSLHITILGQKNDAAAKALYEAAVSQNIPGALIEWLNPGEQLDAFPEIKFPILKKAAAFICIDNHCSLPIFNASEFPTVIQQLSATNSEGLAISYSGKKATVNVNLLQDEAKGLLVNKNILAIIFWFWIFGLLLAFTPCVLPLIIIIVGFLGGRTGTISKRKILGLAFTYVLSLASTYAIAGVIAATCGIYIQAYLQKKWVLILFSLFFVLLALSLLGAYKLKLPDKWQHFFIKHNKFLANYSHAQVAIMAILATLIASPCMAAPLVGVLSYVGSSGNILLGAIALFAVGLGIGTPLLIASSFGTKVFSELQQLQEGIKVFFGLLIMGVAIWLLNQVIPPKLSMILWSGLVVFTAIYMKSIKTSPNNIGRLWKTLSMLVLVYGIVLFVGGLLGDADPFRPLQLNKILQLSNLQTTPYFESVKNLEEIEKVIQTENKPILLDFSAQWCDTCHLIEKNVYNNAKIQPLLKEFVLLRVDLSDVNEESKKILKHFNVIAPPAILFFNKQKEINTKMFGNVDPEQFAQVLQSILDNTIQ